MSLMDCININTLVGILTEQQFSKVLPVEETRSKVHEISIIAYNCMWIYHCLQIGSLILGDIRRICMV